ncbi:unnamed protein product, partial [Ixodes hexagonus]
LQSELISSKGYPVEEHQAITSDGYVIGIQRIPRGINENPNATSSNKTTILLQHGILGASSDFVINFANQSLGFILVDAGYDVWLGNSRGNTYSGHVSLTRDDKKFWEFSADDIASKDLPTMIDTVLRVTGKTRLQYVGVSQGVLVMMALLSEKPEYNKKISLISAMAPVPYLGHVRAPVRLLVPFAVSVCFSFDILKIYGNGQCLPASNDIANLCNGIAGTTLCTDIQFLVAGVDPKQLNKTRLSVYFSHYPAGSSVNNILQLAQLIRCDCFQKFDYGSLNNIAKYGQVNPPQYMLSRVTVPVAIYWSKGDWLATTMDVARLRKELKNVVVYYQVPEEKFTHFDFTWGINAEPILYRKMILHHKHTVKTASTNPGPFLKKSLFELKYYTLYFCSLALLLTRRSFSEKVSVDPDSLRNVSELISSKGYTVEEHEVVTRDGYVIGIQRIPRGKNESPDATSSDKTTILLQHGILGASSDYVLNFPNQSLG